MALMERTTGESGCEALEPVESFVPVTPKRITEVRPLATRGSRKRINLLIPRLVVKPLLVNDCAYDGNEVPVLAWERNNEGFFVVVVGNEYGVD